MSATRDDKGRFLKGKSGNAGGRPAVVGTVRDMARDATPDVIERLREIVRSGGPALAIQAAQVLLDRGWGRVIEGHAFMALDASGGALGGSAGGMPRVGVVFLPAKTEDPPLTAPTGAAVSLEMPPLLLEARDLAPDGDVLDTSDGSKEESPTVSPSNVIGLGIPCAADPWSALRERERE